MKTTKTTKRLLVSLLALLAVFAIGMSAACFKKKPVDSSSGDSSTADSSSSSIVVTPVTYEGKYYFEGDEGSFSLELKAGSLYTLAAPDSEYSGKFTVTDGQFAFYVAETVAYTGTAQGENIQLMYGSNALLFLPDVNYTVTFDMGGSTQTQTVRNGKTAVKPEDPKKEGCLFVNWYVDAQFTSLYSFAKPVTQDITVYARFFQEGDSEYSVKFFNGSEQVLDMVYTQGKKLASLPEYTQDGKEFLGWWTSDSRSPEKLTRQLAEGETLHEDTVLYAVFKDDEVPALSVNADGFTWSSMGKNVSYELYVTAPSGKRELLRSGTFAKTEYEYDFAALEAGEYKVEVVVANTQKTAVAYVTNKMLARPSGLRVDAFQFMFDPVAGAQKYLLSVNCASASHNHKDYNLNLATSYDFSNCEMPQDGMTFTVTAVADGYVSATSETFVLTRNLTAVTELSYDENTAVLTWQEVVNAQEYLLELAVGGQTITERLEKTTYSLKGYTGDITVKVTPYAQGYALPEAASLAFSKKPIATPANFNYEYKEGKDYLTWDKVEGAVGYEITIEGTDRSYLTNANTTEFIFTEWVGLSVPYVFNVQALSKASGANSLPAELTVKEKIEDIWYEDGMLYWDAVRGHSYTFRLNDDEPIDIGGLSSYAPRFNKTGENTLSIGYYKNDDKSTMKWVETKVETFALIFDTRGGSKADIRYLANDDTVTVLDESQITYAGYDFQGWYDVPEGYLTNGKKYEGTFKFNATQSTYIYASWSAKHFNITLDVMSGAPLENSVFDVYYRQNEYVLPVPDAGADTTKGFLGWYTDKNGQGMQYTGIDGANVAQFRNLGNVTLYAFWADAFEFNQLNDGTYSVKQGADVNMFEVLTIPATYLGKSVSMVEGAGFKGIKSLVVKIPDTIKDIIILSTDVGSAFESASYLQAVEVYHVEGNNIPARYFSEDGILYFENETDVTQYNNTELKFIPAARKTPVYVSNKTEVIPMGAVGTIKSSSSLSTSTHHFTEIHIPYTVTKVEKSAFEGNTYVENIYFEDAPGGVNAQPLTIGEAAFKGCSDLINLNLPGRVAQFDVNALENCRELENVNISTAETNKELKSVDGVLLTADGTKLIYFPRGRSQSYTTPDTVTTIGSNAFSGSNITEIVISKYVRVIEPYAFSGVSDSSGKALSGELEGYYKGSSCTSLQSIVFETNDTWTLEIGEGAFYGSYSGKLTEVTLPKNLVKLGKYAFAGRTALKTVNIEIDKNIIGYKKLELESGAFALDGASPSVVTLNIGDNVPEIANLSGIFGSADLKNINTGNNPNYKFADQVLYNGDNTKILYYLDSRSGAFVIPETVTEIGEATFRGKSGLTAITIHAGVTYVGDEAFKGCSNLESVLVRDGETEINFGDNVFENCSLLTDVRLSTRARVLGKNFFKGCKALIEITFPEGITEIGDGTFNSSSEYAFNSLRKVTFPATLEKFGEYKTKKVNGKEVEYLDSINAFVNCNKLEEIVVAEGNKNFTAQNGIFFSKDADGYYGLIICFTSIEGDVVIPAKTNKIWANAFKGNTAITSIAFDGEIDDENYSLEIGSNAFYGCINLKSFELPEGLQTISQNMFYGCTSLERVVVPSTVALIENKAFNGCYNLKELVFTPTKDGKEPVELVVADGTYSSSGTPPVVSQSSPFGGCTSLKEVEFPERTVSIGSYVFFELNIEKVTLPSTLTSLGDCVFQSTKSLEEVVFKTGSNGRTLLTDLPRECFSGSSLKKITLPEGLVNIAFKAFYDCNNLTSIEIPSTVEDLGSGVYTSSYSSSLSYGLVFSSCDALEKVTFAKGSSLKYIRASSFGSTAIKSVSLPASLETIEKTAFNSAKSLTFVDFETYEAQLEDGTVKQVSSLKKIDYQAFQSTAIEHFVFPETLSNITLGRGLFRSVSTLKTITLSSTVADITKVFENINSDFVINPSEQADNYVISADGNFLTNKAGTTIVLAVKQIKPEDGVYRIPDGVEVIETDAFGRQTGIIKLIIPAGVKTIKNGAFHHCSALTEIVFENNEDGVSYLENLGLTHDGSGGDGTPQGETYGVFEYCTALTQVTFPNSEYLTSLPYATFSYCTSLKEITLPEGLTQLSPIVNSDSTSNNDYIGVFYNCTALEKVVLPSTLEVIGGGTFYNCKKLKTVNLPEGLKTIDSCAFYYTSALTSVTLPDSITELGHLAFMYSGLKTLNLNNVTKLGTQVFRFATSLTNIDLSKITEFTEKANSSYGVFEGCTALTSVVLPKNLTRLPSAFFLKCSKLTTVTNIEQVEDFGNNAFKSCTALTAVDISGAKTLGTEVFSGCTKLKTVKLGNALEKLNNKDFYGCTVLATVEGVENVQTLGNYVFQNCKGLKTIDIGKADNIGTNVFDGCVALVTVTLCPTLETLSNSTFNGCTALTTVNNLDKVQKIGNSVFEKCSAITKVDLSSAASLGTSVFANCTKLKTVVLGEQLKKLQKETFNSCSALTDINLENVEEFGQGVFNKCTSLVTVDLSSAKSLDIKLFLGCTKLANVTLGDNITDIPQETFSGCKALKSITLPQGLQHLGNNAFYNCTGLTSIEIPAGVTKLLPKANSADSAYTSDMKLFYGCTNLTKVVFKGEVTVVGTQSFYGCTKLAEIIGADGTNDGFFANLKYIGKQAFYNTAVKSVKLSSLKAMGAQVFVKSKVEKVTIEGLEGVLDDMFADCTNLVEVNLPSNMLYIGDNAFDGCSKLASIDLPNRIYSIGTEAFKGTAFEHIRLPANLSELGAFAFDDTNLLYFDIYDYDNFDVIDGVLYSKDGTELVCYPCKKTDLVDFTGLTNIRAYAFAGWGQEIDLALSEGFVNIEEGVFSRSSIKSLTLPSTLETIGDKAFMNCAKLASVTFNQGLKSIGANAFSGTALTSVTLPDSLETIGESAFEGVDLTGTLTTGSSLQSIGKKAFYGAKIESVVLGDALLTVGESAFEGIKELTAVSGGAQLQEIGKKAFYGTNIESFVFGDALVKIGESAFEATPLTGEVTFGSTFDYLGSKAFKDTAITKVSLNSNLSSFGSNAFDGCANLTEALFGEKLTSIGIYAFCNTKLTQVSFPDTLTSIGQYAFAGTPLTGTLVIPKNVTSIGTSAFEGATPVEITDEQGNTTLNYDGCSKIEEIVLPQGLTTLENNYVFRNCYWLYKVNLENITKLGKEVFAYCGTQNTDKVFSVTIGKVSLTSTVEPTIDKVATSETYLQYTKNGSGPFAFSALKEITFTSVDYVTGKFGKLLIHADMLEKVTLPEGVKSLALYLFAYSGLKSVVIPASVEELSGATFNGCMNLESVVFEEGSKLKTIGYYSFMYCKNLKSLVLPNTVETINHNTFSYCVSMSEIVIPLSCTKLDFRSFTGWTAEQTVKFRIPENMFTSVATDYNEDTYPVTRVFDYAD